MKALSIRQPWAWLIVNGYKDIENRTWPTKVRGDILIHASKGCTNQEFEDAISFVDSFNPALAAKIPEISKLKRGGIVGIAKLTDCVTKSNSKWFAGKFGFVLKGGYEFPFRPMAGMLGFFNVNQNGERERTIIEII